MSSCLDEATILAVGRGTVHGADRLPIEEHVAECDECRALVSAVARGSMLDLVTVLGEGASPKPPSVTIPRADSAALSERVAREVPRSGIEHAAFEIAAEPEPVRAERALDPADDAVTNVPPRPSPTPRMTSAPPRHASGGPAPIASALPAVAPRGASPSWHVGSLPPLEEPLPPATISRNPEIVPTAPPRVEPAPIAAPVAPSPRPRPRSAAALWVGLVVLVVLAGLAATVARSRLRPVEDEAPTSSAPR